MEESEIYTTCVEGIRDFMAQNGFSRVVIGLSGGLDSSVVAALAVDAIGPQNVLGVLMPGPTSSDHSMTDALALAKNLDIETVTFPIAGTAAALAADYEAAMGEPLGRIAAQNVQARARMMALMAISNSTGRIVLNTGNKSEAYMGYSTLYGDMVGAYAPIGGLYKTDVFALAEWMNERAPQLEDGPIPQHVIDKLPSAELEPGQTDEGSLGITYEVMDAILVEIVEYGRTPQELEADGFEPADIENVVRHIASSAFKRVYEPPCPQIQY